MTNEERVIRGNRAKAILEDPLMLEAAAHFDAEMLRLLKQTVPGDTAALAELVGLQQFHGKYQAFLQRVVKDGKIAQDEIDRVKPKTKAARAKTEP